MTDELPTSSAPPPYAPPWWLSHHRWAERHKCLQLGGLHLCARCLATYPVVFAVLALQLQRPMAPLVHPWDPVLLFVLPIPAVVDWAMGQLSRWRGSNAVRFGSGLLLGVSLGRALYIHMRHPGTVQIYAYGLGLLAVAGIVWGLRQVLGSPPEGNGEGSRGP